MKKILSRILAPLMALAMLVGPTAGAFADPLSNIKAITLLSSTSRTKAPGAVTTGAAVNTGIRSNPGTGGIAGFTRHMEVFVDCTVATTANEDLTIQGRPVAGTGTWITLNPSAGWSTITGVSTQVRRYEGPLPAEMRAILTTGNGLSINSITTLSVVAIIGG